MEPPVSLYNEVLGIKNEFLYPSNSKIYEKGPRCNETSLYRGSCVRVKHDSKSLYLQIVSFLPIFFRLFKEQHDPKSIAEMKEEILYKYDENFDGKLELEEVFMTFFYKFSILFFCTLPILKQ